MGHSLPAVPGYEILAAIIDSLPDPTFGINPDGIVIAWNRAIEEVSGVKASDMLGKGNYEYSLRFYGLRRPMLIDMVKLPDEEVHQLFPHFTRNNGQISIEFQTKNIDGQDTYYRTTATPILGQDKTPFGFIQTIYDLTREKEIELELIGEKEAFKSILENSLIGSALVGQDGRVIYANERMIDITGFSLKEIYSGVAGLKMVFHGDDDAELKIKDWYDQLNTKGVAHLSSKLWNNDGSLRFVDFQAVKLADGRMVVSLLDLTPQKEVEQELFQQKELLDTILKYNPAGTALIEVDDRAVYANEKAIEFTGYAIEELPTYESWLKLAYHDDENATKKIEELYEQLKSRSLVSDNGRILQKDGTIKSVDFQAIRLIDGRTIVSIWDVTKQKEIEEELIRQKESLYRILENSPVGSAVVDADGRIVFLNQRVFKITGYTADDLPTEDAWFKLAYPDEAYRIEMTEDWHRQLDTFNKAKGIAKIMHKVGKVRHLDFQAVRLQDGTTIHSIWDLTHQKEIEEALRASEEKFKALSDASLEGILFLENGFCVEANAKGAEMLGYPYEELIGIPVMDLIVPESQELVANNVKLGYMLPYKIVARRKDGSHLPLEVQGRTFSYLGREVRATVMVDLSERVQAQKLIAEQNSHLTSLFTSLPDALVLVTNEDKIFEINPQFTDLFGYGREACIGQSLKDLILPEELVTEYSYHIAEAPLAHPVSMET
ncbi:MAG: PAS domain S-box protein, partial [Ignavibacteriales bacterium]